MSAAKKKTAAKESSLTHNEASPALPPAFMARMEELLGEELPSYLAALAEPPVHGLRLNRIKADEKTLSQLPFALTPLPHVEGGCLIPEGERAGLHPLHHAGAYYMQDPSAMAAVAALPFGIGGLRALDLCAAPGGKTSQLAEAVGEDGLLVSNEIVPSRARVLLSNIERLGLRNTLVYSEEPRALAALFPSYFDLVLVDAPCSGEGMFRKYPAARTEWNEAAPEAAAARSRLILEEALSMLADGGHLLYSTCTFSEEENEKTVSHLLSRHRELSLVPLAPSVTSVTAEGLYREGRPRDITLTRRFYPHLAKGEGQYIALLHKSGAGAGRTHAAPPSRGTALTRSEEATVRRAMSELFADLPEGSLRRAGDTVLLAPREAPSLGRPLREGVALFTVRGNLLLPHHHAVMAFGRLFRNRIDLPSDDPRVLSYLRGEELAVPHDMRGFFALLTDGVPLGLLKCSDGRAKNHYPKGLRI